MSNTIIKTEADDEYVVWNNTCGEPTMWGTRQEVIDYLLEISEYKPEFALPKVEERLARAEATGTSSRYSYGPPEMIYAGRGTLPYGRISAFLESFNPLFGEDDVPRDEFNWALLDPFEDD